jgi:hypothetical protein
MFTYLFRHFSRQRTEKAIVVGATTTVLLYLFLVLIAEPLRTLAATLVEADEQSASIRQP